MSHPQWRIPDGASLLWRFMDGEYVIFHAGSGDTHVLDALAGEVLQYFYQPMGKAEILKKLTSSLLFSEDEISSGQLESAISLLEQAGLIEQIH
jgi:PqqD family protein of HPr-rel-A system